MANGLDYTKEDINPFWQKVIDDIKKSLISSGHNASGNTLQAIEAPKITVGKNSYKVQLIMPDYYAFLDEGVRGVKGLRKSSGRFSFKNKMPPIAAIRSFMINKGIVGTTKRGQRGSKNSQKQLDSIAFAIAKSIFNKGLEQTNFYSNVVNDKLLEDYSELVLEQLGQKVIVSFDSFDGQ